MVDDSGPAPGEAAAIRGEAATSMGTRSGWLLLSLVVIQTVGGLIITGSAPPLPWRSTLHQLLALTNLAIFCSIIARRGLRVRLPLLAPGIAFALLLGLSLGWTNDRFWGHLVLLDLFVPLLVYLAAGELCQYPVWRKRLVMALISVTTLTSMYALAVHGGLLRAVHAHSGVRIAAPFLNPNHAAYLYEMIFPLALVMTFVTRGLMTRLLLLHATALIGLGHLLTLSRGGWFSLCVALLALSWVAGHSRLSRRALGALGAGALVFVTWCGLRVAEEPVLSRLETLAPDPDGSVADRLSGRSGLWMIALEMIRDRPMIGQGVMGYDHAYFRYRRPGEHGRAVYAHNDYLQVAADLGLPGALAVVWMLVVFGREARRGSREADRPRRRAYQGAAIAGCVAVLVHELFDSGLWDAALIGPFAAISAIATHARRSAVSVPYAPAPVAAVLVLLAALTHRAPTILQGSKLLLESERSRRAGEFENAARTADAASRTLPSNPECWLAAGRAWLARAQLASALGALGTPQGQAALARAIESLSRCRELDPWALRIHALLGEALLLKDPGEALPVLAEGYRDVRHNPELALLYASCLLRVQRPAEAERVLRRLLEEVEPTKDVHKTCENLIDLLPQLEDLDRVVPEGLIEARRAIAEILLTRGRAADGALLYERLAATPPGAEPRILFRLSSIRAGQGRTTAAAEVLAPAIEAATGSLRIDGLIQLASLRRDLGETTAALQLVDEVLIERVTPAVLDLRARLLALLGRERESRETLLQAVAMAGDDCRSSVDLAAKLPHADALPALRALAERFPDRAEPHVARGKIFENMGRSYEAMLSLVDATRAAPDDMTLRSALAAGYEKRGLLPQARAEWRTIAERNPDASWPLERIAEFHHRQQDWEACFTTLEQLRRFPGVKFHGKDLAAAMEEVARLRTARDARRAFPKADGAPVSSIAVPGSAAAPPPGGSPE